MNEELLQSLRTAQQELDPQFKALRRATSALNQAAKLAAADQTDAFAMQKALAKLEQSRAELDDPTFAAASSSFAAATQKALDDLAFDFAHDLRETFAQRGQAVEGRPPTLIVDILLLQIDMSARKGQWFYGKEALTRPIPLSVNSIVQAFDRQHKAIAQRTLDAGPFLAELYHAWQELLAKRSQRPAGGRISLMEVYSQVVLNRQSTRFWNAPARNTFRDYERAHFVRDLVLLRAAPDHAIDGRPVQLHLGVATKSQAENASRSLWLPRSTVDGEYYASLWFEDVNS